MKNILIFLGICILLQADSFEEKMLQRGKQLQSIPNIFGGKEFGKDTWLSNLIEKGCPKKVGEKRTKCILKNRKKVLSMWDKRNKALLDIAKRRGDKIVWIAQQTFDIDELAQAMIEGKNSWSSSGKIPKAYRLPTLNEITKACYDKELRKYFYGATVGYNSNGYKMYFKYKDGKDQYINFKTCKPEYLKW